MSEEILLWLISLAPSVMAVVTSVTMLVTWLRKFRELRKEIQEKVELKELQEKLEISLSECRELEKILKKVIEEHTKIQK